MKTRRIPYSATELAFVEARKDQSRKDIHAAFADAFGRDDVTEENIVSLCKRKGWFNRPAYPPNIYSSEELAFIEENQALPRKRIHAEFVSRFGRTDIDMKDLQTLCSRKGWTTRENRPAAAWSEEEVAFVEANQTLPRRDLHAAVVQHFGRTDLTEDHIKSLCARRGFSTGRTGAFEKGAVPVNKGQRCPEGVGGRSEAARKTQFRKGEKPHTYRGPGHEWVGEKDGYVWLIIEGVNPYTGAATRPVQKHRYLWEAANGPIADDMVLKCLDGNRQNCDPSNWEPVARGVLSRLNAGHHRKTMAYDEAPAELKPLILTVAKLKHAVGHRAKRAA